MRRRSAFVVGLVTAGLVVGVGGAPVLAANAASAASAARAAHAASAASAPVRGVWLPARELPGTSLAGTSPSGNASSVDAVACAPGAECVTADDTLTFKTGADVSFLLSEKNGSWGRAQQIPGLPAAAPSPGINEVSAEIHAVACPASGYCLAAGSYGSN